MSAHPLVEVDGVCCVRGHFNDPRTLYCVICGISMLQHTARFVRGPRPPLGVLVWDDGQSTSVAGDLVIGRQPHHHERVAAGQAHPWTVDDGADRLSRAHLLVALDGWDVLAIDLGSTNGTVHRSAATGTTARLMPHTPATLNDGDTVWMGARSFIFESYHAG